MSENMSENTRSGPLPDLLFRNVRLIDPASGRDGAGELLVRNGCIADIAERIEAPEGAAVIAGGGAVLCPGLVDMRAALGEPGFEYRETIASAAAAASAGRAPAYRAPPCAPRPPSPPARG